MFHNALYMEAMYKNVTVRLQDEMAGAWADFCKDRQPEWREATNMGALYRGKRKPA